MTKHTITRLRTWLEGHGFEEVESSDGADPVEGVAVDLRPYVAIGSRRGERLTQQDAMRLTRDLYRVIQRQGGRRLPPTFEVSFSASWPSGVRVVAVMGITDMDIWGTPRVRN